MPLEGMDVTDSSPVSVPMLAGPYFDTDPAKQNGVAGRSCEAKPADKPKASMEDKTYEFIRNRPGGVASLPMPPSPSLVNRGPVGRGIPPKRQFT